MEEKMSDRLDRLTDEIEDIYLKVANETDTPLETRHEIMEYLMRAKRNLDLIPSFDV